MSRRYFLQGAIRRTPCPEVTISVVRCRRGRADNTGRCETSHQAGAGCGARYQEVLRALQEGTQCVSGVYPGDSTTRRSRVVRLVDAQPPDVCLFHPEETFPE